MAATVTDGDIQKAGTALDLIQKYGVPMVFSVVLLAWTLYTSYTALTGLAAGLQQVAAGEQAMVAANDRLAQQVAKLDGDVLRLSAIKAGN